MAGKIAGYYSALKKMGEIDLSFICGVYWSECEDEMQIFQDLTKKTDAEIMASNHCYSRVSLSQAAVNCAVNDDGVTQGPLSSLLGNKSPGKQLQQACWTELYEMYLF